MHTHIKNIMLPIVTAAVLFMGYHQIFCGPATNEEPVVVSASVQATEFSYYASDLVNEAAIAAVSEDDISLIALVTQAEAEGESEYGKRLVIDTILNRVDSEHFPDSVYGVIYQKNQFTSVRNGRLYRCELTEEVRNLVLEELASRTNNDVIFFRADRYSSYGEPMFQEGNHYFSSYE